MATILNRFADLQLISGEGVAGHAHAMNLLHDRSHQGENYYYL